MVHYTCDRCGRSIREERFVAKIEVAAAFDPEELTAEDFDADHLAQISDALDAIENTGDFELEETGPRTLQLDLCPVCCRAFLASPLGKSRPGRVNYSQN